MDDTITQQTFFLFIVPIVALLLVTLVVQITSGAFETVRRRLVGMPDNVQRLERRLARLEAAIVRARIRAPNRDRGRAPRQRDRTVRGQTTRPRADRGGLGRRW